MDITSFAHLVELRTKVASVLPFVFGSLYTLYAFDTFSVSHALIMFLAVVIFDMTTTAINNYMDFKKAHLQEGYGYEIHNAISHYQLNLKVVRTIILSMLVIASLLGIYLVYLTNVVVLLLGMICFAIGILYTFGPLPISRTPFGELFSGVTMGFVLTFITIYIHVFNRDLVTLQWQSPQIILSFNIPALIAIALVTVPFVITIANIMLANNLCDMEEDICNKRYTLPIHIGKENGVRLWVMGYYIVYAAILIAVVMGYLPLTCLASLLTFILVSHNIACFKRKQTKAETFSCAIKNFLLVNCSLVICLGLHLIITTLFF
ncbi:1,4-dihydroxy-2-naphthoate polyprenyltransferase [Cellulosilyticum ruminicola]|uniref:1,4-dihydroxy-2-naphthoate polyprenyltransferase n=1 Tax=Cellulosilyticum ruminicola TaxID=425254 RepID=UPI0006D1AFFB|nr:1,4-dihydroxy-2-naphthoate polyprenyltransferase [Cellulosilyticum ruminicola]